MELLDDKALLNAYESVLTTKPEKGQKEQNVQNFLEEHSELLPTPILLNHQLHFNIIVSKFPLGNEYVTDYVYITKSSSSWKIVLVELEDPNKNYFSPSDPTNSTTTGVFNSALQQVLDWQAYIKNHAEQVKDQLSPLIKPDVMSKNPCDFEYVLIYGRSKNKNSSKNRIEKIKVISDNNKISILSFDTVKHDYQNNPYHKKKIILSLTQNHFKIKRMDCLPEFLSDITSSTLIIPQEFEKILIKNGYDIPAWKKGKLLSIDGKHADIKSTIEDLN